MASISCGLGVWWDPPTSLLEYLMRYAGALSIEWPPDQVVVLSLDWAPNHATVDGSRCVSSLNSVQIVVGATIVPTYNMGELLYGWVIQLPYHQRELLVARHDPTKLS